jgi:hypothetical protein
MGTIILTNTVRCMCRGGMRQARWCFEVGLRGCLGGRAAGVAMSKESWRHAKNAGGERLDHSIHQNF